MHKGQIYFASHRSICLGLRPSCNSHGTVVSGNTKRTEIIATLILSFTFGRSRSKTLVRAKILSRIETERKELHAARRVTKLQNICFVKQHRHRTNYTPLFWLRGRPFDSDHSTSERGWGGGGWVILKKNILQVHMHKKNSCTRPSCQKKFMHVQWAGKKILARCSLS